MKVAAKIDLAQPDIIQNQEEMKNMKKKTASEKKTFDKVTKEAAMREDTIANLEKEIEDYTCTEEEMKKEYENAVSMHRNVLNMRKLLLGDDHLDVAATIFNIGETLHAEGNIDEMRHPTGYPTIHPTPESTSTS